MIDPKDIIVETIPFRTGGFGVHKSGSGIRITHLPTRIVAERTSERSQHSNRQRALDDLEQLLAAREDTLSGKKEVDRG